jgi:long-chain acyl-CoA synthetase
VAENRAFASCLLFPDTDQVRRLLLSKDSIELPNDEVIDTPQLNQQIKQLLAIFNENLEPWERIRDYRIVTDELSIENGGLTPTQKIRRQTLDERYKDLINSMYNNGVEVL